MKPIPTFSTARLFAMVSPRAKRVWSEFASAVCAGMIGLASLGVTGNAAAEPLLDIPMQQSPGGTLYLPANAAGVVADFLLDTGAGMVTLSDATFAAIQHQPGVRKVRQIGARLANNRIQLMDVYELEQFAVGGCELGPLEVAVMKGSGRNLLGLSALRMASPFAIELSPPTLSLSNCHDHAAVAARF